MNSIDTSTARIALPLLMLALLWPTSALGDDEFDFAEKSLVEAEEEFEFTQTRTCQDDGPFNQCSPGQQSRPVQWGTDNPDFVINIYGSQDLHSGDELTDDLRDSIIESFDRWNERECSDFQMDYDGTTPDEPPPFYNDNISQDDNENVVTFKDEEWPHENYDAIALTTVTFRSSTGQILSSDIELNTADYDFSKADQPGSDQVDLLNTMVHEVGHFLGLDHSPNRDASMWERAQMSETTKRTLHDADVAGLCFIYPAGESMPDFDGDNASSDRRSGCGCSTSDGTTPPAAALIAVIALLAVARVRRRVST